ncbi:hypothetical protein AUP68_01586 [Ilyonectria robusta]
MTSPGSSFGSKGTRRSKYLEPAPAFTAIGRGAELGTNITGSATRQPQTCGSVLPPLPPLSPRISETTPEKGRKSGIQNPESESEGHCTRGRVSQVGEQDANRCSPKSYSCTCYLSTTSTASRQPVRSIPA